MAPNTSREAIVAERRRHVAALRLRGLTQREIVDDLARSGVLNADTGKPYSLFTVNADCKALEAEWKEASLADISEHKARHLAETREARRKAWEDEDLSSIHKFLKREAELLGLDAPAKLAPTDPTGERQWGQTPAEIERKYRKMMETRSGD